LLKGYLLQKLSELSYIIKNILALAVGAVISANAFAGYTGYTLGGGVSGYFVQNDVTRNIVYYQLNLAIPGAQSPYPTRLGFSGRQGEGSDQLTSVSTHFIDPGPTNFKLYSNFGGDQFTSFNIDLAYTDTASHYTYSGFYSTSVYAFSGFKLFTGDLSGSAAVVAVDPSLLQYLEAEGAGNSGSVPFVASPNVVPEPTSISLIAAGIMGVFAMARRRKA
jgi:hypothetical protein